MIHEEQIEEIMDYFRFDRVAKVMEALDWHWFSYDGVPPEPVIRQKARELLREVAREKRDTVMATAGFEAKHDKWGRLSLAFVAEQWQTEAEFELD